MTEAAGDFEALLSRALAPIEPSEDLAHRLESTLAGLTERAVDELESWEMAAMRDPRNWIRPVAAVTVGATAGTALVVLRVRAQRKRRRALAQGPADLAQRTARAVAEEARRLVRR